MKSRCEDAIWYIIPALRRELTVELYNSGLTQKEISEYMGITQAAVSQYLKSKRGATVNLNDEIRKEIKEIAEKIRKGEKISLESEICRLCKKIRNGVQR
ncbi:MAG: helix-turn-helix domain-containing protein [Archaeoglobi archaeon]|nr:helix-turn-helix domain-containing protein [Candidatus Mnemosynella sp.]